MKRIGLFFVVCIMMLPLVSQDTPEDKKIDSSKNEIAEDSKENHKFSISGTAAFSSDIITYTFDEPKKASPNTLNNKLTFFKPFSFSDSNLKAEYSYKDIAGFTLQVNAPSTLDKFESSTFKGSSIWIKFGKVANVKAGLFDSRKINRANDVFNEWNYGTLGAYYDYVSKKYYDGFNTDGITNKNVSDSIKFRDIDLLQNFIVSFNITPINLELEFAQNIINADFINFTVDSVSSIRATYSLFDIAKITGIYSLDFSFADKIAAREKYLKLGGSSADAGLGDFKNINFLHNYGIFAELCFYKPLTLVVGYSGKLNHQIISHITGSKGESLNNFHNAIDIRAQYDMSKFVEGLKISSHAKFDLGIDVGRRLESSSLGTNVVPLLDNKVTPQSLIFLSAVGASYNFSDKFNIPLKVSLILKDKYIKLDRATSKNGSETRLSHSINEFTINPKVSFEFTKKINASIGVSFMVQNLISSTEVDPYYWIEAKLPVSASISF